jgi:hypothetical protein
MAPLGGPIAESDEGVNSATDPLSVAGVKLTRVDHARSKKCQGLSFRQ